MQHFSIANGTQSAATNEVHFVPYLRFAHSFVSSLSLSEASNAVVDWSVEKIVCVSFPLESSVQLIRFGSTFFLFVFIFACICWFVSDYIQFFLWNVFSLFILSITHSIILVIRLKIEFTLMLFFVRCTKHVSACLFSCNCYSICTPNYT